MDKVMIAIAAIACFAGAWLLLRKGRKDLKKDLLSPAPSSEPSPAPSSVRYEASPKRKRKRSLWRSLGIRLAALRRELRPMASGLSKAGRTAKVAALCAAALALSIAFFSSGGADTARSLLALIGWELPMKAVGAVIGAVVGTVLAIPLWLAIVYDSAKNNRQLAFIETGDIKFRKWGETIDKVFVNVPDKRHRWKDDLVVDADANRGPIDRIMHRWDKNLDSKRAVFYVSIFYPFGKIATWEFAWPKLETQTHKEKKDDSSIPILDRYVIVQKTALVSSLYYHYTYPVLVNEIELAGNFKISLLVLVIVAVRKPVYLIGNLKGKFMAPAINAISGLLDNGLRGLEFEKWNLSDKDGKIDSILQGKTVLNDSLEIVEAEYVAFDYAGNTADVIRATTLIGVTKVEGEARVIEEQKAGEALVVRRTKEAEAAKHEAEAKVARAKGEADANRLLADAEGYEIEKEFGAAAKYHGGIDLLIARETRQAVQDFRGSTLVLGGSERTMISVPAEGGRGEKGNPPDKKGSTS